MLCHAASTFAETSGRNDCFPFTLDIVKKVPENLLRNPGFEIPQSPAGHPPGWADGNFANTDEVTFSIAKEGHSGGFAGLVRSKGNWPAYWVQSVRVMEGVRYYASVYTKFHLSEGSAGLRVFTEQYTDEGSWATKNSNTDMRTYAVEGQGESLEDFIDERYLNVVKHGQWNLQDLEFIVPTGKKITEYGIWAGAYGIGEVLVDDAYFGIAAFELSGTLNGTALKNLRILDQEGTEYLNMPLKNAEVAHAFKVTLPSRLKSYLIEVTDAQGKSWKRTL